MSTSKESRSRRGLARQAIFASALLAPILLAVAVSPSPRAKAAGGGGEQITTPYVVIGYNDLGMHCMNGDFSELVILPPYNTLRAQFIRRGTSPDVETSTGDFEMRYWFPGNTHSADKTNYWAYQPPEFGPPRPPNVGLTGNRLAGTMTPTPERDWIVTGIPIVPTDDSGRENPYPLVTIEVRRRDTNTVVARTQAVVPVSTEISCNLCHQTPGVSTEKNILLAHDRLHGTDLANQTPVLCAGCHGSAALGLPSQPGLDQVSTAMHGSHSGRMDQIDLVEKCYACHPGVRTNCQRDVHAARGIACTECHGGMDAVGSPARRPWIDEPRCGDCHSRPGFQFEEPGKLYRDSVGHGGVHCSACHGSPHAMGPAITETDNVQANLLQGHAGVINDCTVCHGASGPPGEFFHSRDD
ncbi:MAG: hypothetical protein IT450_22825 [Phycisphaerales bacterium]|nr:hypothetical protein [Phycisphaerales bacterium]